MISNQERALVRQGVQAAYLVPFIDDVEDYVWEAIWQQTKQLELNEGLARTKLLFDVVDPSAAIGWSAKTLVVAGSLSVGREFEFVIQRADIFKKQAQLGYSGLNLGSDPNELGSAVMSHWRQKVDGDAARQGVTNKRAAILLKNKTRTSFAVMDEELDVPADQELTWAWARADHVGLQGRSVVDGFLRYKWYPNQTQMFERMRIPDSARAFSLVPKRLGLEDLLDALRQAGHIA